MNGPEIAPCIFGTSHIPVGRMSQRAMDGDATMSMDFRWLRMYYLLRLKSFDKHLDRYRLQSTKVKLDYGY